MNEANQDGTSAPTDEDIEHTDTAVPADAADATSDQQQPTDAATEPTVSHDAGEVAAIADGVGDEAQPSDEPPPAETEDVTLASTTAQPSDETDAVAPTPVDGPAYPNGPHTPPQPQAAVPGPAGAAGSRIPSKPATRRRPWRKVMAAARRRPAVAAGVLALWTASLFGGVKLADLTEPNSPSDGAPTRDAGTSTTSATPTTVASAGSLDSGRSVSSVPPPTTASTDAADQPLNAPSTTAQPSEDDSDEPSDTTSSTTGTSIRSTTTSEPRDPTSTSEPEGTQPPRPNEG